TAADPEVDVAAAGTQGGEDDLADAAAGGLERPEFVAGETEQTTRVGHLDERGVRVDRGEGCVDGVPGGAGGGHRDGPRPASGHHLEAAAATVGHRALDHIGVRVGPAGAGRRV